MADLFLSYARRDIKRAEAIARLLEDNGLTVWWDSRMVAGDKFNVLIEEEIEKAKAVIVLWSPNSVKSDWVLGEAQTAHELAKLVPIKIDECKLPINYRGIHTPAVSKSKAELQKFAQMLSDKIRTVGATTEPSTATKIEFSDKSTSDFLAKWDAQGTAFQQEWNMARGGLTTERLRLIKKYPLGFLEMLAALFIVGLGTALLFIFIPPLNAVARFLIGLISRR